MTNHGNTASLNRSFRTSGAPGEGGCNGKLLGELRKATL